MIRGTGVSTVLLTLNLEAVRPWRCGRAHAQRTVSMDIIDCEWLQMSHHQGGWLTCHACISCLACAYAWMHGIPRSRCSLPLAVCCWYNMIMLAAHPQSVQGALAFMINRLTHLCMHGNRIQLGFKQSLELRCDQIKCAVFNLNSSTKALAWCYALLSCGCLAVSLSIRRMLTVQDAGCHSCRTSRPWLVCSKRASIIYCSSQVKLKGVMSTLM